jgi:hypothetical protein
MKYIVTFPLTSVGYKERVKRFLETGALPPAGVTMHGRWHTLAQDRCFLLAETEDPSAIYKWVSMWADMINFEVHPVLDDKQAAAILGTV